MKNILIIHSDQHRFDCIGAYGNKEIKTPNIDSLAVDGVVYKSSYCIHPICTPSRYSMLTGVSPYVHGGTDNNTTLLPQFATLPNALKQHGFQTACVGKMHFRPTYLDVGFDQMILAEQNGEGRYEDDYHRMLKENNLIDYNDLTDQVNEYYEVANEKYWKTKGAMTSNLPEKYHSTTFIGNEAYKIVNSWDDQSHLLMVGFIKPHHPFDPPKPWADMYDPSKLSLLKGWSDDVPGQDEDFRHFSFRDMDEICIKNVMAKYYGTISQIDNQVGDMVQLLKDKGIYDNTMIIYTSDHGEYMGFHHLLLKCQNHYEPLMKIPLIIKYPNNWKKGTVDDHLVSNIDLAPTILEHIGISIPDTMKGIDMNKTTNLFVFCAGDPITIRSEKYKLMCKENGECLFFDLKNDPMEFKNLYNDLEYTSIIMLHMKELFNWYRSQVPMTQYVNDKAPISINAKQTSEEDNLLMKEYIRVKMSEEIRYDKR